MQCRVLGPVEVLDGDAAVALGGSKPRLLIAVLLAHRGRVVPLDGLVDALWGATPPPTAAATVQTHVSRVRRVLGEGPGALRLETRAPGYRLAVPDDALDAGRFEERADRARRGIDDDPRAARDDADSALAEWRGPAFVEFAAQHAVRPEATRLEELRITTHELAVDARLACGQHREVIGTLDALVSEHPLRERFWTQLMLALYRSGRPAEALRRAQVLRRLLRDELGLDPSAEVRTLETDILTERAGLAWVPPPSTPTSVPASPPPPPSGTPLPPGSLIGRTVELTFVGELLTGARLVTLTGPGGVGKTRLAQELLSDHAGDHADGVRIVELAPVRDPGSAVAAVAGALELRRRPERSLEDSIVDVLAPLDLLLVLDNCEHLLDAVAPLVSRVLRRCPTVRVLATSREPLGLPGEITWSLPPLPVPVSTDVPLAELRESPAVVLFTARARAARPGFAVGEDNRRDVAEICIRLDGVPLALELAAARIRSLTSADLAARLDERFRLLAGIRGVDPRHHALIDVVTWSHDLLTPSEQELFVRLSVFAGGFDLQRAEEVCSGGGLALSEVAALLAALVDKSMVVATEWAGRMRYRLLETLRAFARDRLEAGADATPRYLAHAHSYLETAREAGRALDGPGERGGVAHLEENFEDLREAFWRSLALGELDTALGFVAAVREFAFRTLREEVFGWAEAASSAPGAGSRPLYPVVRAVVAYGVFTRGALREASEVALDAVEAADRLGAPTGALAERVLGNTHFHRGETDEALHWMDRMIVAAESSGEEAFVAHARYMSSVARTSVDDPHGARQAAAACRAAAERCGAPTALAQADYAEALLIEHDDPDRAITLLQRSVASAGLVSNRWLRAFARTEELFARARRGELTAALDGFGDVVETWFRGGDWPNQWLSLRHLFGVFVEQGEDELAGVLHGAIEAAGATIALPFQPANAARASGLVDVARIHYGAEAFDAAVTRGRAMRDEEVVRLVLRHLGAPRW